VLFVVIACAAAPEPKTVAKMEYDAQTRWICQPGAPLDACKTPLTTTEIAADGARTVRTPEAVKSDVDCFYVYPTVDLELVPGNHTDFSDPRRERNVTLAQAGPLSEVCNVWAPLYRQVTIGTYLRPKDQLEAGLAIAFGDVEAAFREYLRLAPANHEIVVVGHSQGAEMVVRLVKKFFDGDPAMRARLLLAMPIGGDVEDDTFANVPPCTKTLQTGCFVAYRSFAAGDPIEMPERWKPRPGHTIACVNPATVDASPQLDGTAKVSRAFFPVNGDVRRFMRNIDGVETPFVAFRDHYTSRCMQDASGFSYLEIAESSPGPIDMHKRFLKMGLHLVDMQIPSGDLVELVRHRQVASAP
jgi:hypothetical protein